MARTPPAAWIFSKARQASTNSPCDGTGQWMRYRSITSRPSACRLASKASSAVPCSPLRSLVVEEILAGDTRGGNRCSHTCLVAVAGGRIDVPVADFQRVFHHGLRLFWGNLENAEAQLGKIDPVVQSQVRNHGYAYSVCLMGEPLQPRHGAGSSGFPT